LSLDFDQIFYLQGANPMLIWFSFFSVDSSLLQYRCALVDLGVGPPTSPFARLSRGLDDFVFAASHRRESPDNATAASERLFDD